MFLVFRDSPGKVMITPPSAYLHVLRRVLGFDMMTGSFGSGCVVDCSHRC